MPDAIEQYYETTGSRYRMSSTRRDRVLALVDTAIEHFPQQERIALMDIGIGSGEIAKHCREQFPDRSLSLTGVDIAQSLLKAHAELYDSVRVANVDTAGWTSAFAKPFQIVVASELVEHLFRPDIFFKTVRTVLTPDGYLVLSTPNMLLWSQRIKFLLGRHRWSDGGVFEWGHIHLFSWKFLVRQLEQHGFKVVATKHLLHPNALHRWQRLLSPGLFAFQFIVLAQKK